MSEKPSQDDEKYFLTEKVRIPKGLFDALLKEQSSYTSRGLKAPKYGELLQRAWDAFKSIAQSSTSQPPERSEQASVENGIDLKEDFRIQSADIVQVSVRKSEIQWVEKFLKVKRSRKPGLSRALENNVDEFAWADDAYDKLTGQQSQQSPPLSAQAAGTSGEQPPPNVVEGDFGDRGSGEHDQDPDMDIKKRVDEITRRQKERRHGKKGAPGKTGSGS